MSYSESVNDLFVSQLSEWDLARQNYQQLGNVKVKKIDYGAFSLVVQFNPGRITSSSAKVDTRSIEARPCFLCEKNRPVQQRGLPFENGFTTLINPFPIFKRHLTIVSDSHIDQRIQGNFEMMLKLAKAIPDFVIFYNGPQCGASAPDHLHFQAGNKGFLPIENDFTVGRLCRRHSDNNGYELWLWRGYQRGIITLKGDDTSSLIKAFETFVNKFAVKQSDRPEPMLNILASYSGGFWIVHLIPRKLHRPSQFFAEGDSKILLSPASVDMGGVVITPREDDFNKITPADISDILNQTCYSENELLPLIPGD